jgi:predicted metal-dependent hydrolase
VHRPGERGVVWLEASERGPLICVSGERPHVARRVADFLKREARKDLEAAVARHSKRLGVKPRRIVLRDTVSRWGSCSSTGGLNFSWRLILAPPFVLDYLAAHEVAHIVHMNHSPMFWKLTRRLHSETDRAEVWLKIHGPNLHRFGATWA